MLDSCLKILAIVLFFCVNFSSNGNCQTAKLAPDSHYKQDPAWPLQLKRITKGAVLFANREPNEAIDIYSLPGHSYRTGLCRNKLTCQRMAVVDRDARLIWTGEAEKVGMAIDDVSSEFESNYYLKVNFDDLGKPSKGGTGWIRAETLVTKKYDPAFVDKIETRPQGFICATTSVVDSLHTIRLHTLYEYNQNIKQIAEKLKSIVGSCPLSEGHVLPKKKLSQALIYDELVLPGLQKHIVPTISKENGQPMTREDLISIDALARTIYGEMAICHETGIEYLFAVAKIGLNRGEKLKTLRKNNQTENELLPFPSNPKKGLVGEVVTQAVQFDNWDFYLNKRNPPLLQSLCPPTVKISDQHGEFINEREVTVWNDSLRIAAEAILFPEQFTKLRAPNLTQLFYTSGKASIKNMRIVPASVIGRPLTEKKCMKVYEEIPPRPGKK